MANPTTASCGVHLGGEMITFRRAARVGRIILAVVLLALLSPIGSPTQGTATESAGDQWIAGGSMNLPRDYFEVVKLADGRVLVAGGVVQTETGGYSSTSSVEVFDPEARLWVTKASMHTPRVSHSLTVLPDGKVLAIGGANSSAFPRFPTTIEIYDPALDTWSELAGGPAIEGHVATLLADGRVFVTGGGVFSPSPAMIYDPIGQTWLGADEVSQPTCGRMTPSTTLLRSGKVLVAGGHRNWQNSAACAAQGDFAFMTTETYDPGSNTWSSAGDMAVGRHNLDDDFHLILLPDDTVMAIGGQYFEAGSNSAPVIERYNPGSNAWSVMGTPPTQVGRAALLSDTMVLATDFAGSTWIYDAMVDSWSRSNARLVSTEESHSLPLNDGSVIYIKMFPGESAEGDTLIFSRGTRQAIYYFALGDSIAAGHGLEDDGPGNDSKAQDPCRLAKEFHYPAMVEEKLREQFGDGYVHAYRDFSCSGATAQGPASGRDDVQYRTLAGQVLSVQSELAQIPVDATVVVSISIGANDLNFVEALSSGRHFKWWKDFEGELQNRLADAKVALIARINDLVWTRPDIKIVLTELHNPFNPESVFFLSSSPAGRLCFDCYGKFDNAVTAWNDTLREIAEIPAFQDNVVVTTGMQAEFYNHRSPGGAGLSGGYSYVGGGCGLTPPWPSGVLVSDPDPRFVNETWIQYRNDQESWSYSIPNDVGNAKWQGKKNKDPDIFYNPQQSKNPADEWRGDCFHPNRAGSKAIAGFVLAALGQFEGILPSES